MTKAPFDDQKVRLAFAKAIDREAIVAGILAPMAIPAYSWLMPGFPDADQAAPQVRSRSSTPTRRRQLLADAGFPGRTGLPAADALIRGGGPESTPAVTQAVVASITQTLGVQIDLQTLDQAPFMEELLKKPTNIPFGWVTYGMDYLDATNMLSVWKGGGRHNWNNAEFDKLVDGGRRDHQRPGRPEQGDEGRRATARRGAPPGRSSTTRSSASCTSRTERDRGRSPTRPATPAPSGPARAP